MKRKDWADKLAEQIEQDVDSIHNGEARRELIAMRLRLVRHEGALEGIGEIREAMK